MRAAGWSSDSRIASSAAMTARKLTASITKAAATPTAPMTRPATAGPMTRALLNIAELSATALPMSSRPTISTANDWRTGMSTALTVPMHEGQHDEERDRREPGDRDDGEGDRQAHLDRLGRQQRLALGQVVGEDAGEQAEHEDRDELGGRDDAQPQRVVGQQQDQPGLGDRCIQVPIRRDRLAAEEQPVVAVTERASCRAASEVMPRPATGTVRLVERRPACRATRTRPRRGGWPRRRRRTRRGAP